MLPNVITLYRLSRWLFLRKIPLLPKMIQGIIFLVYNCNISYKADIGSKTIFLHRGMSSLVLDEVVLGKNCRIGMNVMITGRSPYKNVPRIGDNVWIGPGTIISGPVIVEDNVIIGPNSMLLRSVSAGHIVVGNPARVIGKVEDLNYNIYENPDDNYETMPFLHLNK
jgi:serine O-acetyltransferase